ncbi:MAG: hypothetical protein ACLPPF_06335 [Rhodomicrobium sp.]
MKATFVAVAAVVVALSAPALAQDKAPPPASKADVQKLVSTIKGDPAKMKQFCDVMKLDAELEKVGEKDPKKADEMVKQEEEMGAKIAPNFGEIMSALSEETGPLVEDLQKTCK